MTTQPSETIPYRPFRATNTLAALMGVFLFALSSMFAKADIPDKHYTGAPVGYYKVAQSTDPIFPNNGDKEFFLDFGNAISRGETSGTVAVSMRQNPNVKVRMLVWQLYPETGTLVLGAPSEEGSRKAVALVTWKVSPDDNGLILQRETYQVALNRALDTD